MAKTLLSLLIGAAFGAGILAAIQHNQSSPSTTAAATPQAAASVTVGTPYAGEINKNSYLNVADGSRSQVFAFTAQEGQFLDIRAKGALDSRLSVLRDGYILASNDQQGSFNLCESSSPSPLLKQSHLFFQVEQTGTLNIAVNGTGPYSYGPFELDVRLVDVPKTPQTLSLNAPVNGIAIGKPEKWALSIEKAGLYAIELNSCHFDGYLTLTGPGGINLSDDDSGDNHYDPRILAWLEPGEYTATATTSGGLSMRGQYQLQIQPQPVPEGAQFQKSGALQAGHNVITVAGQEGSDYTFTLERPSEVILTARSEAMDVYLTLENDDESWSDDDSGGGVRGTDAQIHETLPAGQYRVHLGGYGQGLAFLSLDVKNP